MHSHNDSQKQRFNLPLIAHPTRLPRRGRSALRRNLDTRRKAERKRNVKSKENRASGRKANCQEPRRRNRSSNRRNEGHTKDRRFACQSSIDRGHRRWIIRIARDESYRDNQRLRQKRKLGLCAFPRDGVAGIH